MTVSATVSCLSKETLFSDLDELGLDSKFGLNKSSCIIDVFGEGKILFVSRSTAFVMVTIVL